MKILLILITAMLILSAVSCGKSGTSLDKNSISEFHNALADGDAVLIERLIKAKPALVNAPDENGELPLQKAKRLNLQETATLLIKYGAKESDAAQPTDEPQ